MQLQEFFGNAAVRRKIETVRALYTVRDVLLKDLGSNPYLSSLLTQGLGNRANIASTITSVVENLGNRSKIEKRLQQLTWQGSEFSVDSFGRSSSDFFRELRFYLRQEHASLVSQLSTFRPASLESYQCESLLDAWDCDDPDPQVASRGAVCVALMKRFLSDQTVRATEDVVRVTNELQQAGFLEASFPVSGQGGLYDDLLTINNVLRAVNFSQVRTTYQSLTSFFEYSLAMGSQIGVKTVTQSQDPTVPIAPSTPQKFPRRTTYSVARTDPSPSAHGEGDKPVAINAVLDDVRIKLNQLDAVRLNNETLDEAIRMLHSVRDLLIGLLSVIRVLVTYVSSIITNAKAISAGVNTVEIDRGLQRIKDARGYARLATSVTVVDSVKTEFARVWGAGAGPSQ